MQTRPCLISTSVYRFNLASVEPKFNGSHFSPFSLNGILAPTTLRATCARACLEPSLAALPMAASAGAMTTALAAAKPQSAA
eukprot:CAMPEP_0172662300 /NCGR_PEP_ID=MMETSP1074-20121228/5276_1 /TAXON_ID=2916 /ORGANISM="Ceratium fusus, Strain PA161109" /LENGTH=81 /DNA_ID=CAMNT_0013478203 /DNA_START=126 /DNA_END=371 /DNA_ORIENTATION=-